MENQFADSQMDEHKVKKFIAEHRMKEAVKEIIAYIGDDPTREGVIDTPKRVVKSWKEIFGGYAEDPEKVLGTTFEKGMYDQMIICKDIEFYSTCEHHMIPFFGKCHIAYIPGEKVVGLSKMARLVEVFCRRLQIQEKLTDQIKDTMNKVLKPKGVMVVIESKHLCMCGRGVSKQESKMVTSSISGAFEAKDAREEFLRLIK